MKNKKFDDDYVPVDVGSEIALCGSKTIAPQLPKTFDLTFIKGELGKIAGQPSMIANFITALRANYNLSKQVAIINRMEDYYTALAGGMASQTEMERKRKEYLLAIEDLNSIKGDIEIQRLKKELTNAEIREKIALKNKSIENIKAQDVSAKKPKENYHLNQVCKNLIEKQQLRAKRRQLEKNVLRGRKESDLNEDEILELEDIRDTIQNALDNID